MVCNAIRTAKCINQYSPIVKEWDSPYFVTLTAETVDSDDLRERITKMQKNFTKIRNLHNKQKSRKTVDFEFKGIRKLECTYNFRSDKYHPHFHILCNCKATADFIISNWLRCMEKEGVKVDPHGQDSRPANNKSLVELFKYMTKVVTRRGDDKENKKIINAKALDIIFNAMKRRHTIRPFGFKVSDESGSKALRMPTVGFVIDILTWSDESTDWLDKNGKRLTNYVPSDEFKKLLDG